MNFKNGFIVLLFVFLSACFGHSDPNEYETDSSSLSPLPVVPEPVVVPVIDSPSPVVSPAAGEGESVAPVASAPVEVIPSFSDDPGVILKVNALEEGKVWVAKKDGSLWLYDSSVNAQEKISTERVVALRQNKTALTSQSRISAISEIDSSCGLWLVIGSEDGYVFKSRNGGQAFVNADGEEGAVAKITGNLDEALNSELKVESIRVTPGSRKTLDIEYAVGNSRLDVCASAPGDVFQNTSVKKIQIKSGALFEGLNYIKK